MRRRAPALTRSRGGGRHWDDAGRAADALREHIAQHDLQRLPSDIELVRAGRHDLRYAIRRHGAGALADLLGLPQRRRGRPRRDAEAGRAQPAGAGAGG